MGASNLFGENSNCMNELKLRAWWSHRQGLDGSLQGESPAKILERTGWSRSVGGVGPYLTFFSRAGIDRQAVDKAIEKLEVQELPSARGCTYVVPNHDFALALTLAQPAAEVSIKTAIKLGVTEKEMIKLCTEIQKVLAKGPQGPSEIRELVGDAARSLGEPGKKKGISTTIPPALGRLRAAGVIRSISTNGRLDIQRYTYTLWKPNPLEKHPFKPGEAAVALARRFFKWVGPATLAEFQWFSGFGVKVSAAAIKEIELVPLESGSDRFLLAEDLQDFLAFKPPSKPQFVLVSSLDPIAATRRELSTLVDEQNRSHKLFVQETVKGTGSLSDLPCHAILDRGRIVGLWEYDFDREEIAWCAFVPKSKELSSAIELTQDYVKNQLGDARSFSLDTPPSRAPRIAIIRGK